MTYESLYKNKEDSYFGHTRPELVKFIPNGAIHMLDVGCGKGNFGGMLKTIQNYIVWGVEPDKRSAEEAEQKLDKVFNGLFDGNLDLPSTVKFDCIFFNDVLEHLVQPEEALSIAMGLLSENGCIIASIPNIRFYPAMLSLIRYKDFRYLEAGVMDKTHLRFFTEKSMRRLFEENGFQVEQIEGINKHEFKYLNLLNAMLFNGLSDMKFPQFAVVARKISDLST